MSILLRIIVLFGLAVALVQGHGMMLDPAGRSSRWRTDPTATENVNDNELFCGGFVAHWTTNKGQCGLCGDNYSSPTPRDNEDGGLYGQGVIVKTYKTGDKVQISTMVTSNHKGEFYYDICNLDAEKESEECFGKNKLKFASGDLKYVLPNYSPGWFNATVQIPSGLKCKHCVLRWTYRTGNTWGWCDGGTETGALGCGPQEHFRSCADVSIV